MVHLRLRTILGGGYGFESVDPVTGLLTNKWLWLGCDEATDNDPLAIDEALWKASEQLDSSLKEVLLENVDGEWNGDLYALQDGCADFLPENSSGRAWYLLHPTLK